MHYLIIENDKVVKLMYMHINIVEEYLNGWSPFTKVLGSRVFAPYKIEIL